MIGRGAVANPALFRELTGGGKLRAEELQAFLDGLAEVWLTGGLSLPFTLERMKTLWIYMKDLFPEEERKTRAILKSKSFGEYRAAVSELLRGKDILT